MQGQNSCLVGVLELGRTGRTANLSVIETFCCDNLWYFCRTRTPDWAGKTPSSGQFCSFSLEILWSVVLEHRCSEVSCFPGDLVWCHLVFARLTITSHYHQFIHCTVTVVSVMTLQKESFRLWRGISFRLPSLHQWSNSSKSESGQWCPCASGASEDIRTWIKRMLQMIACQTYCTAWLLINAVERSWPLTRPFPEGMLQRI